MKLIQTTHMTIPTGKIQYVSVSKGPFNSETYDVNIHTDETYDTFYSSSGPNGRQDAEDIYEKLVRILSIQPDNSILTIDDVIPPYDDDDYFPDDMVNPEASATIVNESPSSEVTNR